MKRFCCALIAITLSTSSASALLKIQNFDSAPTFEEPEPQVDPLPEGGWGVEQDGLENVDELNGILVTPFWNSGGGGSGGSNGWLTTVGLETAVDNLGPVGPNAEGLAFTSIKTSVFTGVLVYDDTSWGDVSTATHVTMDVKGSFEGSGGISVYVFGDNGFWWSWGAAATDLAVGANPGDVTEWTNITIPINRPDFDTDELPPAEPGEAGVGGNWGVAGGPFDSWDSVFASVNRIDVRGLTPDSQIDNLGFILPDVGLLGDFDRDGDVDGNDFLKWQRGESSNSLSPADLLEWKNNFGAVANVASVGAVPEPSALMLAMFACYRLLWTRKKCESSIH